ncbi:DUF2267 domain-containing protein [Thiohalomonas denitrificans]|uniref:DUF2267 domain-containing protein n=1 Tax=Thiohalomonas denitrificans TaxID=415747 RepID=UPI0026F2F956|nr:DUF2267 domain-containing protein [Thiohalomonas denitrificans]
MQLHDFLGQVQHRAQMPDLDAALRASRATLETLAERLAGNEPAQLGAQLPRELREFLQRETAGSGERFDSTEFLKRVSEREGIDLPVAVYHARTVIEVLREAVSAGEINDVLAQLPEDYKRIFEAGTSGSMPMH